MFDCATPLWIQAGPRIYAHCPEKASVFSKWWSAGSALSAVCVQYVCVYGDIDWWRLLTSA